MSAVPIATVMEKFIVRNVNVRAGNVVIGVMAMGMRIAPHVVGVVDRNVFPAPVQVVRLVQVGMDTEQMHGIINADGAGEEDMWIVLLVTVLGLMNVFHAMALDTPIALGVGEEVTKTVMSVMVVPL